MQYTTLGGLFTDFQRSWRQTSGGFTGPESGHHVNKSNLQQLYWQEQVQQGYQRLADSGRTFSNPYQYVLFSVYISILYY